MMILFLLMFGVQLSYQLQCFQCNTVRVGRFSGVETTDPDNCLGYEDLGKIVTCEDPRALCYQEYYYRDMYYDGRPQTDVYKWEESHLVQPDRPDTIHPGYEGGIPAGSVWRGCRVPNDRVSYQQAPNSYCRTFRGEKSTSVSRYWMGSECYCDKDLCNSAQRVELGFGTLALLTSVMLVFNH